MKKNFKKIVLKMDGRGSTLIIASGKFSIKEDSSQRIVIIRDSAGNAVWTVKVIFVDNQNNWHVECGNDEFLISVDKGVLYIVRKPQPNEEHPC